MTGPADTDEQLTDMWRVPVAQRWSCFALPRGAKVPTALWKRWQEEHPDEVTVRNWAENESNVGIVTGAISGLVVLDLDSHEAIAEANRRGLPQTIKARTGRGLHVYFEHPGGAIKNSTALLPGMDLRGDGGYVVGPGSLHASGTTYEWENSPEEFDLAPMPEWLVERLHQPEVPPGSPAQPLVGTGASHPYAQAALESECGAIRSAPDGKQESTLNAAAFKMGQYVGGGSLSQQTARGRLLEAAQEMPSHDPHAPWITEKLATKIDRALRDGTAEPKGVPDRVPSSGEEGAGGAGCGSQAPNTANSDTVSEDAIARVFTDRYHDRLRFNHSTGKWLEWDGTCWQPNDTKLAFHLARGTAREMSTGAKSFCKASVANGVESFARADPAFAITQDRLDTDPWLLGTPGGTVDLRTGLLREAQREDLITKRTGCAPEKGEPHFCLQFLNEATAGDAGLMRFLQQVAGYCLTGLTNEHALFFIYGPGGNGKSVFLNTLNHVLGDYATTAGMETFTASKSDRHPTDLAMLNGARLVSASETEEGRAWAESRIKQVTGGDKISARFMRQDFFEFLPQFKLVIVGNHAPVLANVDEAARRRFNIIPFTNKPATPDRELEDKLKAEAGQILSWAIAGCLDWQDNGLVRPEIVTTATANYFEEQDLFGQWMEERCERDRSRSASPTSLYDDWCEYARAAGDDPGTQRAMSSRLNRAGFQRGKSMGQRVYRGLCLKPRGTLHH